MEGKREAALKFRRFVNIGRCVTLAAAQKAAEQTGQATRRRDGIGAARGFDRGRARSAIEARIVPAQDIHRARIRRPPPDPAVGIEAGTGTHAGLARRIPGRGERPLVRLPAQAIGALAAQPDCLARRRNRSAIGQRLEEAPPALRRPAPPATARLHRDGDSGARIRRCRRGGARTIRIERGSAGRGEPVVGIMSGGIEGGERAIEHIRDFLCGIVTNRGCSAGLGIAGRGWADQAEYKITRVIPI